MYGEWNDNGRLLRENLAPENRKWRASKFSPFCNPCRISLIEIEYFGRFWLKIPKYSFIFYLRNSVRIHSEGNVPIFARIYFCLSDYRWQTWPVAVTLYLLCKVLQVLTYWRIPHEEFFEGGNRQRINAACHVCQTAFSLHNDGPKLIDFVHRGIGKSICSGGWMCFQN